MIAEFIRALPRSLHCHRVYTHLRNPKFTFPDTLDNESSFEKRSSEDCEIPVSCNDEIQSRELITAFSHRSRPNSILGSARANCNL